MHDIAIKNGRVHTGRTWEALHVYIKDGHIAALSCHDEPAKTHIDATNRDVLPGLIDPYVHFELDLGDAVSVDDFAGGSHAALHGGITTVIDFLDPTDTIEALKAAHKRRKKQAEKSLVDVRFHATLKAPKCDLEAYVKTVKALGMHSIKVFTTYSESNRRTDDIAIATLLRLTKAYDFTLVVHAERDERIVHDASFTHKDLPISRPEVAEMEAALTLAEMVRATGGRAYMVHTSSGRTVEMLKTRAADLLNKTLFLETCPQYVLFNDERLRDEQGKRFTFAPPLRDEAARKKLLAHADALYAFGTDHCAFHLNDKDKPRLSDIPLGIGGVEFSYAVMNLMVGDNVVNRMSRRVAELFHIDGKGIIATGAVADVAVLDPTPQVVENHHGNADYSVYTGETVSGHFTDVIHHGVVKLRDGKLVLKEDA